MSNFTTPAGRLVSGNLYTPSTTDQQGNPRTFKAGKDAGKPRAEFYFAIAIPKGSEQHWASTPWGAELWKEGHAGNPNAGKIPTFAWKVKDGDSTAVDPKGKAYNTREGHAGHWILSFSGSFQPKIYTLLGVAPGSAPVELVENGAIRLGYYIQVNCSTRYNGNTQKPGVFINPHMVCLVGYGPVIVLGPDVADAGFGAVTLPAGASTTPPAGFNPPAAQPPAPPVPAAAVTQPYSPPAPPMPAAVTQAYTPPVPAAAAPTPPLPPVTPDPGFRQPPTLQPTAKCAGATLDSFRAQGWTDTLLVEHGYAVMG